MHAHHAPTSTAGLLLSLQAALPAQARKLLTATDCVELAGFAEDGCLDQEFDS